MNALLDDVSAGPAGSAADRLRTTTAAVRLSFTWMGVRKTLTPEQRARAAESFGAEGTFLSAGKKLLDTAHPAYKAVTQVRGRAVHLWKGLSLPYPEPGVRLIRQGQVGEFDRRMTALREELAAAVARLDERYAELQAAARRRLGGLYNAADYPASLRDMFAVDWDFPAVEPPDYLRRLSPELYEQEARRVAARFDEAVRLAEAAFAGEFSELLSHLCERLSGTPDGRPKIFRDSAVENLREFFGRFRALSVGSSDELERLVEQAQQVAAGVRPQDLRDDDRLRRRFAAELSRVQSALDGLMVDRPRRNILRSPRPAEAD